MINNKIGGRNMVGRAVNRLAGRLTAVALTAAMAVSMLAGCAAGGKNTETAAKKEYKPSAMEQMNAKNDPNVIQDITGPAMRFSYTAFLTVTVTALGI